MKAIETSSNKNFKLSANFLRPFFDGYFFLCRTMFHGVSQYKKGNQVRHSTCWLNKYIAMLCFIQKVLLDLLNEKQTERSMFELELKEILHVTLNEPWIVCPTATGN